MIGFFKKKEERIEKKVQIIDVDIKYIIDDGRHYTNTYNYQLVYNDGILSEGDPCHVILKDQLEVLINEGIGKFYSPVTDESFYCYIDPEKILKIDMCKYHGTCTLDKDGDWHLI